MEFGLVWSTADVLMGFMALINLPVILLLGGTAIRCMKDYVRQKKEGRNPVFKAADIGFKGKNRFLGLKKSFLFLHPHKRAAYRKSNKISSPVNSSSFKTTDSAVRSQSR